VIESQRRENSKNDNIINIKSTGDNTDDKDGAIVSSATAFLFAFGFAIPCVAMEPIYVIRALEIKNAGLILVFLATPIVNSLRITEGKEKTFSCVY